MHDFNIATFVWGTHHIDLFKKACFRSMCWPKNYAAIKGATWNIFTKHEHVEELKDIFKNVEFTLNIYPLGETVPVAGCGMIPIKQCDAGVVLLACLREQIRQCLGSGKKMLFAPPDTVFGDGTIPNLIQLGSSPKTCVTVSHPRVLPSLIEEMEYLAATRGGISNAQLVTLAFKHAHDSWKFAEMGHASNNSFVGGIAWKELDKGLYSVQHRLPTVYFADFNATDWDFWWGQVSFGAWDHRWPAENLIRQERQRHVGSSDACMIVEITDYDKNVPPEASQKGQFPDSYWNGHYHNGINRQTLTIFRGE